MIMDCRNEYPLKSFPINISSMSFKAILAKLCSFSKDLIFETYFEQIVRILAWHAIYTQAEAIGFLVDGEKLLFVGNFQSLSPILTIELNDCDLDIYDEKITEFLKLFLHTPYSF